MKTIPFKNNQGQIINLAAKLTINDMVKRGIKFKLEPKGKPLPDGWYANLDLVGGDSCKVSTEQIKPA